MDLDFSFWCLMPFAYHLVTCPNMRTIQPDLKMLEIMKLNLVFRRTQLTFYQENCIVSALSPRFVWLCLEVMCHICEFVVLPRVLWKHIAQSHSVPQNDTTKKLISNNAAVPNQNESYPGERKHLIGSVCCFLFHELIPTSETGISNVAAQQQKVHE